MSARLKAQLDTMPLIEQVKGIIMAREGCGPEEAFDLLRRASQRANLKLYLLAAFPVEQTTGNDMSTYSTGQRARRLWRDTTGSAGVS